jgi:hypothetical protein
MTKEEAQCFKRLQYWKRKQAWRQLLVAFKPQLPWSGLYLNTHLLGKSVLILLTVLLSPLLVLIWMLQVLRALLVFPVNLIEGFMPPRGLRGPGERTLRGMHYQFASHSNLAPDLYINCVNDWVKILYGPEQLPKYALSSYLHTWEIGHSQWSKRSANDIETTQFQISRAREDLSRDLGNYT